MSDILLKDTFFLPGVIEQGDNFDGLCRGLAQQPAEAVDRNIDASVKEHLFRTGFEFGGDLKALDINRGRLNGLPSYNDFRSYCGLKRAQVWSDFKCDIDQEVLIFEF